MISVILPTYGRPDNLKRAIESVIKQTIDDWELIIVDDNDPKSKDRELTSYVVKDYLSDSRINYVCHEENKNGSAARNTGILKAKGEYISFLDDDDEYLPSRLEYCLKELNVAQDLYCGVYTGCIFYHDNKIYAKKDVAKTGNFLVKTLATTFNSYSGSNIFIKRSIIDEIGLFDESFIRHQDYEFLVRLFEKYDLIGISKLLLAKYENGSNIPNLSKMEKVKERYLSKYLYLINTLNKNDVNYIYYSNYIALAIMALECNDKRFKSFLRKALQYRYISIIDLARITIIILKRFVKL